MAARDDGQNCLPMEEARNKNFDNSFIDKGSTLMSTLLWLFSGVNSTNEKSRIPCVFVDKHDIRESAEMSFKTGALNRSATHPICFTV
jgi:hypothetical protein